MNKILTNNDLVNFDVELSKNQHSVMFYFSRGKIENFYRQYGGLLSVLKKKISLIQDEYFVIENKDIKYETIEDKKVPVMKEGKTLEEYSKVYSDLMAKEV